MQNIVSLKHKRLLNVCTIVFCIALIISVCIVSPLVGEAKTITVATESLIKEIDGVSSMVAEQSGLKDIAPNAENNKASKGVRVMGEKRIEDDEFSFRYKNPVCLSDISGYLFSVSPDARGNNYIKELSFKIVDMENPNKYIEISFGDGNEIYIEETIAHSKHKGKTNSLVQIKVFDGVEIGSYDFGSKYLSGYSLPRGGIWAFNVPTISLDIDTWTFTAVNGNSKGSNAVRSLVRELKDFTFSSLVYLEVNVKTTFLDSLSSTPAGVVVGYLAGIDMSGDKVSHTYNVVNKGARNVSLNLKEQMMSIDEIWALQPVYDLIEGKQNYTSATILDSNNNQVSGTVIPQQKGRYSVVYTYLDGTSEKNHTVSVDVESDKLVIQPFDTISPFYFVGEEVNIRPQVVNFNSTDYTVTRQVEVNGAPITVAGYTLYLEVSGIYQITYTYQLNDSFGGETTVVKLAFVVYDTPQPLEQTVVAKVGDAVPDISDMILVGFKMTKPYLYQNGKLVTNDLSGFTFETVGEYQLKYTLESEYGASVTKSQQVTINVLSVDEYYEWYNNNN